MEKENERFIYSSNLFKYDKSNNILVSDNKTIVKPGDLWGSPFIFEIKSEKTGIHKQYRFFGFERKNNNNLVDYEVYKLCNENGFIETNESGSIIRIDRVHGKQFDN